MKSQFWCVYKSTKLLWKLTMIYHGWTYTFIYNYVLLKSIKRIMNLKITNKISCSKKVFWNSHFSLIKKTRTESLTRSKRFSTVCAFKIPPCVTLDKYLNMLSISNNNFWMYLNCLILMSFWQDYYKCTYKLLVNTYEFIRKLFF